MNRIYNMKHTGQPAILLLTVILLNAAWGCTNDERIDPADPAAAAEVSFGAMLDRSGSVVTRSSGERIPVNPDDFGETSFYIYERGTYKDTDNPDGYPKASVRPYWLESGTQGQLDIRIGFEADKLNWFAADTKHLFWSWTWPLKEKDYSGVDIDTAPEDEAIIFIDSDFPLPEDKNGNDGDPAGGNAKDGSDAQLWRNGEALERLVGAVTERPYIFNEDGRYVPLTYKHLVSRIILGEFVLVDNTGASQRNLMARITFYGMPKRAMFFPLPDDDSEGNSVAPYVIIDPTDPYGTSKDADVLTPESETRGKTFGYDLSQYLTFYITNEGGDNTNTGTNPDADANVHRDMFYICPGVDFTHLEYKVEFVEYDKDAKTYIPHSKYGNRGGYFGNFKSVQFKRETEGSDQPVTDRVLRAGEEMVLNMTVYEKSGPGAGVWIRNWDSEKLKSATHHEHKGIYSDAEAAAFRDVIGNNGTTKEQKDDTYYIYGEDEDINNDGTDEHVVRLYNDVTLSSNHFRLYDNGDVKYILDGMGFTLTFTNTSTVNPAPYELFYIGNVRDIYVSNGIYTIYINPEGVICRMSEETGKYEPTDERWQSNTTAIYFDKN